MHSGLLCGIILMISFPGRNLVQVHTRTCSHTPSGVRLSGQILQRHQSVAVVVQGNVDTYYNLVPVINLLHHNDKKNNVNSTGLIHAPDASASQQETGLTPVHGWCVLRGFLWSFISLCACFLFSFVSFWLTLIWFSEHWFDLIWWALIWFDLVSIDLSLILLCCIFQVAISLHCAVLHCACL